uniref:Nudix hydrolase domain-containing protein n=1 Tax=Cannabis sativa TaxID=3483 RepID=A0A803QPL1_CANSA
MAELVARTGRQLQRYKDGCRLIAGCIPFRYRNCVENGNKVVEGGWENDETVEQAAVREAVEEAGVRGDLLHFLGYYSFKSKTLQDEFCPEGLCKAAMFALLVKEELQFWPEQSTRQRSWLTIPEAMERCRHQWMRMALEEGFLKWHEDTSKGENNLISSDLSLEQD